MGDEAGRRQHALDLMLRLERRDPRAFQALADLAIALAALRASKRR